MAGIGWQELIIILVILIVLFGAGRITKLASELGGGIRSFKDNLGTNDSEDIPEKPGAEDE